MKDKIRILLVSLILVGGTAFFGHWSLSQFNSALNSLSASYVAIATAPAVSFKNNLVGDLGTTTPEITATSTMATSTAPVVSFLSPKEESKLYIGCTYPIAWQLSTTTAPAAATTTAKTATTSSSVHLSLIDADTEEAIGPIASGLPKEIKIKPDARGVEWKVGAVHPGEYLISMVKVHGPDVEAKSSIFAVEKMPDGTTATKRDSLCKESSKAAR